MRTLIGLLYFIVFVQCSAPKGDGGAVDSTSVASDSSVASAETAEPVAYSPGEAPRSIPSNFPAFNDELFTEDPTEAIINDAMFQLLDRYDTARLLSIRREGEVTFMEPNDYEGESEVTITRSEVWYFDPDSAMQLRAYSKSWTESGSYTETKIYLFDKQEMIAAYEDHDATGQDTQLSRYRAVFSKCPKCGIVSLNPNMGYGENSVEILGEDYKERIAAAFWKDYDLMTSFLETSTGELDAEMYITREEVKERSASFDLNYTMDERLAIKFIPQNTE
jgi:hypothetical protein